ncbi:MAG TPA: autotransporter domain-containing protein, partial [bacterium]|nr:autotransporter domain-containing protein [bacterium]
VFSGGTLKTTTTGITLSNTITGSSSFNITTGTLNLTGNLGGLTGMAVQNGILNLNLPSNQSFAFNITGTGSLETSGTHTLTLSGTNSYSGATYLNGGILSIGSSTNIGSGNINFGGGTLQTTSTTTLSNNMSGAGVINAGSNSLTLTGDISSMTSLNIASGHLDLDPSANETLNFGISGAGSLSLDGSSVVTLSGPGSNTYSGGTALNGVTVVMTNTDVLGTGTVTLNGGNLEASLPLAVSPNFVLGADSTLGGTSGINFFGNFNLGGHILTVTEVGETELLQGVISGSGSLVENASGGTLFLFSNDSYTGGTTITAGTLQTGISNALPTGTALEDDGTLDLDGNSQQVGSLTGTGSVTNTGATEGNLTVNNSSADSFAGNMAGDMQLTKSGAGTLTLTGDISSITSLDIAAGNLALDPSAAQTLSFNITGGGSLSLDGSQVFTLGGTNTYSGGSALNGVTVVLAHNNVLGSGTVTLNGGMLESSLPVTLSPNFTLGADATLGGTNAMSLSGNFNLGAHTLTDTDTGTVNLGGVISGSGSLLENAVGGTLNLSGANSYTGASTVTAGTLQLGASNTLPTGTSLEDDATVNLNGNSQQVGSLTGTGAVTNTSATAGTLTINNSSADSFAGDLTGNLGLTKTGAGTLTLAGVNSYTGLTTVNGGTLVASGINLPGGANVGGSGTLQATGSFGGTITNNGLLYTTTSPGTPGALSGGSFTQGSSGALVVDASPTSASLLTVTGAASLNGSLYLNQDLGNWGLRYRYVIVSAGSITGSFTTTIPNLYQGFTDTLAYGSNAVTLTLIRTNADFTANAQGSNQTAVGKVLNGLIATGSDAILNDLNQIYALSVADQKTALAGLTGQVYTALPTVLLGNLQTEDGLLFARLDGGAQLTPNPAAAAAMGGLFSADVNQMGQAGNAAPLAQVQSQGFWLQNTDNFGSISGNANVTAFNQSDAGFLGGYDAQLMPGLTGGLMGGYVHTTVTAQDGTGQTGVDGYQFGVYGKQSLSDIELEMVAGYGLDHFKTNRTISLGSGSNAVQGTTDGSQMEAALQGDYRMEMDGIIVMPLAGVEYAHFNENAFTETGAGGLSLSLAGQSYDSLRPYVGVNGAKTYALGGDMKLTPMVNLSLSEELAENAGQFQAAFTGASTNSFTVTGVAPSGTLFGLGLGVNLALGKPLNLFASYNGHFSGTESLNGFSGGLSLSF